MIVALYAWIKPEEFAGYLMEPTEVFGRIYCRQKYQAGVLHEM